MDKPPRSVVEQTWAKFICRKEFRGPENPLMKTFNLFGHSKGAVAHTDAARGPLPVGADASCRETQGAESTQGQNLPDLMVSVVAETLK